MFRNPQFVGYVLAVVCGLLFVCLHFWRRNKYANREINKVSPLVNEISTNNVDPLAEAEVYVAYGRKAQAIDILEKALLANPKRSDLRAKLDELRIK